MRPFATSSLPALPDFSGVVCECARGGGRGGDGFVVVVLLLVLVFFFDWMVALLVSRLVA